MNQIQIYGSARTSASRCFFMLEELGVPYKVMPLDLSKREQKGEAYLKLNPNGKVPCLIDDGFTIWESISINYYLAEKYRPELLGSNIQQRALAHQWSTWAMLELQPPLIDILIQTLFVPEEKRDLNVIQRAEERWPKALEILDNNLNTHRYIAGDQFTLADINLASVVNIAISLKKDISSFKKVSLWMEQIRSRPSFQRLLEMRKS